MTDVGGQIKALADGMADLCRDISVRDDKQRGPFVLAFGLKNVHSLELRKVDDHFEVELWHGATYDVEYVAGTSRFETPAEALELAREWLRKDAV
jgi:pyruvate carboxylase